MPNDNRFHEMEQQFNELRRAIASDIADRFEASERRLRDNLSKDMADQFTAMGARLEERLEQRLDARLGQRLNVQAEQLREIVKTAADNYGGVLAGIERDLAEFRKEWRSETEDTRKVLANRRGRIEAIEKTLSSS